MKDNGVATIPSDAPTSPPAPSHAAAPTRGNMEQGIDSRKKPQSGIRTMYSAPIVRVTRIQSGTRLKRFPEGKKKGPTNTSDYHPIRPRKEGA